jgi:hypothetical protein
MKLTADCGCSLETEKGTLLSLLPCTIHDDLSCRIPLGRKAHLLQNPDERSQALRVVRTIR